MTESTLYTIGYGNKQIEDFVEALKAFDIQYLVDVRSKPYSRWNPAFKKQNLESTLQKHQIIYVFAGDQLGGYPQASDCYDAEGKVDYDKLREKAFFKAGLQRLVTAHEKQIPLAIMCRESDPQKCHRSLLIGRELLKKGIAMNHIISPEETRSQEMVVNEGGKGSGDLFGA